MKPADSTIPLGKLGWLVLLAVLGAPAGIFYLATPKDPLPAPPPIQAPPSKLRAVGLRENRDLDSLPGTFAVWADRAHWRNDRTRFAWWNPGTQRHDYFFEARRTAAGYRFREIPEPQDRGFEWDHDAPEDNPLRLYLPVRARLEDPVKPLERNAPPSADSPPRVSVDVKQPDLKSATKTGWPDETQAKEPKKP